MRVSFALSVPVVRYAFECDSSRSASRGLSNANGAPMLKSEVGTSASCCALSESNLASPVPRGSKPDDLLRRPALKRLVPPRRRVILICPALGEGGDRSSLRASLHCLR